MSEDVYFKLGERLNHYPVKMLLVDQFLDILKEFYSEEEAAVGAAFPMGTFSASEVAAELGRDEAPLAAMLETMADNGTIFTTRQEDGSCKYALTPFVPGVVEFQLMRGTDTPKDRRWARKLKDFMEGDMAELMAQVITNEALVKEMIPEAPARVITVEKELPRGGEIFPYEEASKLMDKEDSFSVSKCYCRHHAFLVDDPCKVAGVPEYSCMMFGKVADYIVERKFGKRATKEEALEVLRQTEEAGLVHNTNNFMDGLVFVCNCCGCCCEFIKSFKRYQSNVMMAPSNFDLIIDADSCVGCGDCVERCQLAALSLEGDIVQMDAKACVGCGNCVTACPSEALSMKRRASDAPPEVRDTLKSIGI